jgi:type II secretory pathway pseudopilin PulG
MDALEPPPRPADRRLVRLARARKQDGFGLIELLMAMTILNIGLLAIVAAFQSGAVAIRRASRISTASALADSQMELYRALTYTSIALDSTTLGTVDNTYKCDSALGSSCPNVTTSEVTTSCAGNPVPNECNPSRAVTGADRHRYRVDTYIVQQSPPSGRPLKLVTVVVRDYLNPSLRPYARESSTFDQSTG